MASIKQIVGDKTLTSEEVIDFAHACPARTLVLDEAVAEKVAEAAKLLARVPVAASVSLPGSEAPTPLVAGSDLPFRAGLLGTLRQLSGTRTVARTEALRALAAAGAGVPTDAAVAASSSRRAFLGALLAAIASGTGCDGAPLQSEVDALLASSGDSAGIAIAAAALGSSTLAVADAVTAATAEAIAAAARAAPGSAAARAAPASAAAAVPAVRALLDAVAPEAADVGRPHAGVVTSAGAIRSLTDNSRSIAAALTLAAPAAAADASRDAGAPAEAARAGAMSLSLAPQAHGAAAGPLAAALKAASVELNATMVVTLAAAPAASASAGAPAPAAGAGAAPAGKGGKGGKGPVMQTPTVHGTHPQVLLAALAAATASVAVVAAASLRRAALLRLSTDAAGAAAAAATADAVSAAEAAALSAATAGAAEAAAASGAGAAASQELAWRAACALHAAVRGAQTALAAEAAAAASILAAAEADASAEAAAKEVKKAEAKARAEAAEAARVAAMSPEEKAKHEETLAKRAAKAAKEAAKEATATAAGAGASSASSSGGASLPLASNAAGVAPGVLEWLAYLALCTAARTASGGDAAAGARTAVFTGAVPPAVPVEAVAAAVGGAGASTSAGADALALPRGDALVRSIVDRLGSGGAKRGAKIAKGARDFGPEQMEIREKCFGIIRGVFKRHGAVEIDTPVFEARETLMGKYGEEGGKLIYDLADQGGELLSLRYDLTVPFARYVAMHGATHIKRFHIARVYRRDNPQMARGRFREFYQCDFDVAGSSYAPMMPDAEVLAVASEILASVPIGDFAIKLNHRKLLDATLDMAGVPTSKFRQVCSSIDKLDKEPWADVRAELIGEKGISGEAADAIGRFVQLRGEPKALHAQLSADAAFSAHPGAAAALLDLGLLFRYLEAYGSLGKIVFDLSLARGLDYYTGVIYEAVLTDPSIGVGSIAAGGRYDNLVGMFTTGGTVVPCVGVSIGVERVLAIMENKLAAAATAAAAAAAAAAASTAAAAAGGAGAGAPAPAAAAPAATGAPLTGLSRTPVSVFVASIPSARFDMTVERLKACAALWAGGVSAETSYSVDPKLQKQVTAAAEGGVPFMVVLGEDELDKGLVQVKDMKARSQAIIPLADLVPTLLRMGAPVINSTGHATAPVLVPAAAAAAGAAATAAGGAPAVGGAGAGAAAAPAAVAVSAASARPAANAAPATVGVTGEGGDRRCGRFSRPAESIL